MKDIKSYVIGFLTCACLFLIMGQTSGTGLLWEDKVKVTNKQLDAKIDEIKWDVKDIKFTVNDISGKIK